MKFNKLFNKSNRRKPRANAFVLESLEPRLLLSATPMMAAVVTTDHLDYAPGETAVITTSNTNGDGLQFEAGELVRFEGACTDGMGGKPSHQKPGANEWGDDRTVNHSIGTTTTLTSSAATSIYGDAVTLTARVTPAVGNARPVGSVEFFDGTRSLGIDDTASKGSGSTSVFGISISSLPAGTHTIHAVFTGGTGREPERAGSERHDAQEHRDLPRQLDEHRRDGELHRSHHQDRHERHHSGDDHADRERLKHHLYNNSTSGNLEQMVSQKSLTASFTAASKTYDGTTTATVQTQTLVGVIASDDVSLSGGTATFVDANAGSGKIVTLTGATLTGAASGNYSLTSVNTTTADITKASVTLTGDGRNGSGYFGTYDGQAHAATATVTGVGGVVLGPVVSSTPHTNAGVYSDTVTYTDMTGNYKDTSKNIKSYILKASVTLTGDGRNGSGYFGTYDGQAHAATATVTGVGGVILGPVVSSTTHTNAGVYSDTVTFLGDANYKAASKILKSYII
jgi:hypothetical protein